MHHSRLYTAILAICFILITTTTSKTAGQILDSIKNIKALNGSDDLFVLCTANKDDKACIKTIVGMQDCFILNECYNQKLSEQMNVHCWNCWVDYVTDSHTVSDFQDQIRKRNWAHQASTFGMLLIIMILTLFAL